MATGIKLAVIVINIVLLTVGLLLLAIGIWSFLDEVDTIQLANIDEDGEYSNFRSPGLLEIMTWVAISCGVVIVAVAVLALVGVKKNSKWMLVLSGSILVLAFLMMFITIALGVVVSERIKDDLKTALYSGILTQYQGTMESKYDFSEAFDMAQVQFDCCGVYNYTDFKNSTTWIDRDILEIPRACCKLKEYEYTYEKIYVFEVANDCARAPNSTNSNIDKTCYDDIKDSLLSKTYALMAVSCIAALVQILAVVVDCCLARFTKDKETSGDTMYH